MVRILHSRHLYPFYDIFLLLSTRYRNFALNYYTCKSMLIDIVTKRALEGTGASIEDALELNATCSTDQLCEAADKVRRQRCGNAIDTCSIVNARSGRCPEDCKWCAQSHKHKTGITEYDMIGRTELLSAAKECSMRGVKRLSLVTSGRKVQGTPLQYFCDMYREISNENPGLFLCASMGLLDKEALRQLHEAGVKRYHCNLETGSSYFPSLCTTHSHTDKLHTIRAAREVGMDICCGGIIGMGETMRQRLELAVEARDAGAVSMPINILSPIPGTALENTPLIGDDEIVRTAALFRLIAPDVILRFAGGRARLPEATTEKMLRGGVNGAMIGDMLTTIGNSVDEDYKLFKRTGFNL